jgi:outer membrane lipoprotein SlyB
MTLAALPRLAAATLVCISVAACAPSAPRSSSTGPTATVQSGTGTVESVDVVSGKDPGLVGAIVGGVAGGVLGSQVGQGRGTTVATIAGVLGGAIAGREVERRVQNRETVHKIVVRMDNGAYQTIAMEHQPGVRVGDRVRIDGGQIVRL